MNRLRIFLLLAAIAFLAGPFFTLAQPPNGPAKNSTALTPDKGTFRVLVSGQPAGERRF